MPPRSRPGPGPSSSIQDAQRTRVVVDAIVQAGLSARIAFSLAAGLAGQARRLEDDDLLELVEQAAERAEQAKNADMTLDAAFADELDAPQALRDAAKALERAAETFEIAADMHERIDAIEAEER